MDANTTTTHGSNILKFDGTSTAVVLTSEKLNPDMFNRSFTITTWLKRDAPINKTYDHKFPKEHVLCISDDHVKSRHHVALYVRNCRLGLLLRREPRNGDQVTVFRPAEWRWNLEGQLCGGEWHHYAISVNQLIRCRRCTEALYARGTKIRSSKTDDQELARECDLLGAPPGEGDFRRAQTPLSLAAGQVSAYIQKA
ncbi:putative Calsyntenin-1 [Hypsibius exemplaris]|uniref:Calsyntenin-1 n=1 Tax=Hypsibius exemplaris TaxID=2072580 RepID=A0A9X6NSE8_HYPEX|nr:putative Calsyntenin-1 [Hypsibius exemplaris]